MTVTVIYQYKDRNGSLRGRQDVIVKGSGSAVDKATKKFLQGFYENKQPGSVYILEVRVR